jgi:CheY-like chemotaxis protein
MMSESSKPAVSSDGGNNPRESVTDILLVDDNPGDVGLIEKAFENLDRATRIHIVSDGVDALAFLRADGDYDAPPRPDLVLLDLNMPRKDGDDVLREIQEDPELRRIPVVILTSSDADGDVLQSYDLQANAYLTKPRDFAGYLAIAESVEQFWLETVTFPPK